MSFHRFTAAVATCTVAAGLGSAQVVVTVGGQSNPWLSGMPNGTLASFGDVAPAQSPVLAPLSVIPGAHIWVTNVVGSVGFQPGISCSPDGCGFIYCHAPGAQNGIANACWDRASSLVGVFLSDEQPSLTPAPVASAFNTAALRDYETISPLLKQVFFLGDGLRQNGDQQRVVVPAGATRLFLGVSDGQGWFNNVGSFMCTVWTEGRACDSIDFNNDGALFDPCDIDSFLLLFSEGPCTLCGV